MKVLYKDALINAKKFDGEIYKSWNADLIDQKKDCLLFYGIFNQEIVHPELGIIRPGTISLEYFWLNKNFNIFKFFEPEGFFRNFYCNVCLPPIFENGVLDYIDLDVDVIVTGDFSFSILDKDEFEKNAVEFGYSRGLKQIAETGLMDVIQKIRDRVFPFDTTKLFYKL